MGSWGPRIATVTTPVPSLSLGQSEQFPAHPADKAMARTRSHEAPYSLRKVRVVKCRLQDSSWEHCREGVVSRRPAPPPGPAHPQTPPPPRPDTPPYPSGSCWVDSRHLVPVGGAATCGERLGSAGGTHTPSPTIPDLLASSSLKDGLMSQPTAMSWASPRRTPHPMQAQSPLPMPACL